MITAREAALNTLYEIFFEGAYSNLALKKTLKKCHAMKSEEKRLLTNIVYGVTSYHYTLEYVISLYSSIKVKKLAKYVRLILEMGLYQLMFADKIPESAAVNESVKLAKRYGKLGADRFVNGVLRSFCRSEKEIEYPKDKEKYLAVKYSFDEEMTRQWISDFGYEFTEDLMKSLNSPPPVLLRTNILKTNTEELCDLLKAEGKTVYSTDGNLIHTDGFDISESELYRKGYFSVQDKGAYNAAMVLSPEKGETVIDMCAAPGGKSTHMAEMMQNEGKILAFDIYEHKIKLIDGAVKRLGIDCVTTGIRDASVMDSSLIESADKVLCDVPCSGWGIIRRKPDIKLAKNDVSALPALQLKILCNGAEYLKKGGSLVYSTCTVNRRENEEVVNSFLSLREDFEKSYEKTYYPNKDNSDGFYICRLERK